MTRRDKSAKKSEKGREELKIKKLITKFIRACSAKFNKIESDKAVIKDIRTTNLQTTNIITTNIQSENALVENLQVTNINGRDVSCEKNFTNSNLFLDTTNPLENPGNFNKESWDKLVSRTLSIRSELADRLQCGRLQEKYIQNAFGCIVCPPNELQGCAPIILGPTGSCCLETGVGVQCIAGQTGSCPSVPLNIYGVKSFSPLTVITCNSGNTTTQLLSNISYNLDVINVTGTLSTRVVSVLVHIGYLDTSVPGPDKFVYRKIDFGNRQFGPTLDTLYGEKYTGVVTLPTDLISYISTLPDPASAIVQMVIFAEEGVAIEVPSSSSSRTRDIDEVQEGPVDTQSIAQTVGGQVQWANIYANYSYTQPDIVTLESTFKLSQSAPSTQWVMGWFFDGPDLPTGGPGGYFGINTDTNGQFMWLASIFNAALSANPAQSFVTPVEFGGEGVGWSLRITPENISNFPVNPNIEYKLRVNRQSVFGGIATWEFNINDLLLGTITTKDTYKFIRPNNVYQFSEYFGNTSPTIPPIPLSVIEWTFPKANNVNNSANWEPWTPPPQHCGACTIMPTLPNGPVILSYGGCGTCLGVNQCNTGC